MCVLLDVSYRKEQKHVCFRDGDLNNFRGIKHFMGLRDMHTCVCVSLDVSYHKEQ